MRESGITQKVPYHFKQPLPHQVLFPFLPRSLMKINRAVEGIKGKSKHEKVSTIEASGLIHAPKNIKMGGGWQARDLSAPKTHHHHSPPLPPCHSHPHHHYPSPLTTMILTDLDPECIIKENKKKKTTYSAGQGPLIFC